MSEIYHHGIKGQKWGVRRFQNLDGTWTNAGKERYGYDQQRSLAKLADNAAYRSSQKDPNVYTQEDRVYREKDRARAEKYRTELRKSDAYKKLSQDSDILDAHNKYLVARQKSEDYYRKHSFGTRKGSKLAGASNKAFNDYMSAVGNKVKDFTGEFGKSKLSEINGGKQNHFKDINEFLTNFIGMEIHNGTIMINV